ncbi:MAG: outer membrane beta-barrel protein [Saprospiraceae bacterium]|nr:outer membrane beta-barrel protein [Saprospiraceae bacterium]
MKSLQKSIIVLILLASGINVICGQYSYNSGFKTAYSSLSNDDSDKKFFIGITAGAGLSTCRYDYNSITPPPSFSFRIVPAAGLSVDWRMSRSFSMQMNIMYKEKGDKIDMSKWIDDILKSDTVQSDGKITADGSITTKLAYIEASLIPTITIANLVEIGAGGFLGYGLSGKEITDYSIKYENYGFPFPDETYNEERKVKYILIAPEEVLENELYINQIDYGLIGHLGVRVNPFKVSLSASYSLKQWEPDSKLSSLFIESFDHTYNLSAHLTLSWFF